MPKLADDVLTLKRPQLDENGEPMTDDYGNPLTVDVPIKQARIRRSTKFIQSRDGQLHKCLLSIDLPPDVVIAEGDGTEFHPIGAALQKGKVIALDEALNPAGKKVYFRTVYVE
ncbi:hypothetical protein [Sporolactobacillus terrae]|uniref:hypothetical protein n=1 Tax=Sporolactobacillus terrae TaxID=269673 RepID=UPI001CBEC296|nr:hypothetical protein [Sporolactobacillus terrae]UAK17558.1 hypothetical protein K7399_06425 [Sporolactobacillus terrae]